jgi:hypothetical protein
MRPPEAHAGAAARSRRRADKDTNSNVFPPIPDDGLWFIEHLLQA